MKQVLIIFVLLWFSFSLYGQNEDRNKDWHVGVAVNSGFSLETSALNISPTGIFYINRHQIELGYAIYLSSQFPPNESRIKGGELTYRFYPNNIGNTFSLYFVTEVSYRNVVRIDYFWNDRGINPFFSMSEYEQDYLSLIGGFGFDVKILSKAYIGTSFAFGTITSRSISNNLTDQKFFDQFGLTGAVRLNIGYRF